MVSTCTRQNSRNPFRCQRMIVSGCSSDMSSLRSLSSRAASTLTLKGAAQSACHF